MSFQSRARAVAVVLVLLVSGCAGIRGKTVARKDPPNFLIADDGSICVVSSERFAKTEIGMKALCVWKGETRPAPRFAPDSR